MAFFVSKVVEAVLSKKVEKRLEYQVAIPPAPAFYQMETSGEDAAAIAIESCTLFLWIRHVAIEHGNDELLDKSPILAWCQARLGVYRPSTAEVK